MIKNVDLIMVCMEVKELDDMEDIYVVLILNRGNIMKLFNIFVIS